jgi:hypothetical protein
VTVPVALPLYTEKVKLSRLQSGSAWLGGRTAAASCDTRRRGSPLLLPLGLWRPTWLRIPVRAGECTASAPTTRACICNAAILFAVAAGPPQLAADVPAGAAGRTRGQPLVAPGGSEAAGWRSRIHLLLTRCRDRSQPARTRTALFSRLGGVVFTGFGMQKHHSPTHRFDSPQQSDWKSSPTHHPRKSAT